MKDYKKIANKIRKDVLRMIFKAQVSHIGSCFSCVDILTVLFDQADFKKDKLVVSKGWVAAVVYALAAHHNLIPKEDLDKYCMPGSKYIGLLEPLGFWGAEFAGGSMGYGLPAAVGFALSKKLKGEDGKVYCLMSDGEMQCGTTWESALIASHHKLDNLVVIVDYNQLQAMAKTNEILNIEPIIYKWMNFGWCYQYIDGHNLTFPSPKHNKQSFIVYLHNKQSVVESLDVKNIENMPQIIIAKTIKGKGVSFMENQNLFHYKNLSEEEFNLALKELNL